VRGRRARRRGVPAHLRTAPGRRGRRGAPLAGRGRCPRMSPTHDPANETVTSGPPTAVTGASGALGGRVATRLVRAGVPVRLLGRDPARLPALPGADLAPPAPYGDGEAMRRALAG